MLESEDGTVTGSIDVSKLDQIEPKTGEAKAQIEVLKAENQAAQEQANADAERLAEQHKAQSAEGQRESQTETTTQAGVLPETTATGEQKSPDQGGEKSSAKKSASSSSDKG